MKSQLQVLFRQNVVERLVRRIGPEQAHNPPHRVSINQFLHGMETANDDHGCTSNLNLLRNMAAASLGGKGLS